jgi:hypothetical protein
MKARSSYRAATHSSFAYSSATASKPWHERKVHEMLDPKRKNSNDEQVRESKDTEAHPNTVPIVVGFDETGSMGSAPRILQQKLATLKGATLRAGLTDAQLCFAAYGDAQNGEVAPVQVGHFESGVEMEDWLNDIYLEGNGGGNNGETAGLLMYFLANHSRLDCIKRGKKGYLILTGDEVALPKITRHEVKTYLGYDIQRDYTIEEVVAEVQKTYQVFFFLVDNMAAKMQDSLNFWTRLLGPKNVIKVQDLDNISEQIALLVARYEGVIDSFDAGTELLLAEGADAAAVRAATRDLAPYEPRTVATPAKVSGKLAKSGTGNRVTRL